MRLRRGDAKTFAPTSATEDADMYLVVVLTTMVLAPLAAIAANIALAGSGDGPAIVAKWLVFWAVGIRLLLAGLRQMIQPDFTSRTIFGIDDPAAAKLVSEIGFANIALGCIATVSMILPGWVAPAGTAGVVYLGLAGIQHVRNRRRNLKETIAMVSDLAGATVVALALLVASTR